MKTRVFPLLILTSLLTFGVSAQEQSTSKSDESQPARLNPDGYFRQESPKLTTFDLAFPGGTPKELVVAIQEAMGQPVNVIIQEEYDSIQIPMFEVHHVTLPQLLVAVSQAGRETSDYRYGFITMDKTHADTSIWTLAVSFRNPRPAPERFRQFYQLAPYLEVFQVEDITTAVETAWSMKTIGPGQPMMRFHKDTQLLIAMGTQEELGLIEQVLSQLKERLPKPAIDPQTGHPIPQRRITN
ncbi:MAG TPA: hypothetical protein VMS21_00540 [Methylomirabilota bacterium]|nr:hypothetical protein [Methylomirabilota bacterium]